MLEKTKVLLNYFKGEGYTFEQLLELRDDLEYYGEEDYAEGIEIEGMELIILTDEEADQRTREEVENGLGFFIPEWLSYYIKLEVDEIKKIQSLYGASNPILKALIDDFDQFYNDTIAEEAEGRGHFLSYYDGIETEVSTDEEDFYIYRIN